MSDMARNMNERQEFWRPPVETGRDAAGAMVADDGACETCGSEFVMGSRFCHVCGAERHPQRLQSSSGVSRFFDLGGIRSALGLTTGSLIAFFVGIACVLAAIGTGIVFSATTVLDWQAVQVWRIEWLLAAVAAFVAGVLLKRTEI